MNQAKKKMVALLFSLGISLAVAGCGERRDGAPSGGSVQDQTPSTVTLKSGTVTSDSWGYTGAAAQQVAAPAEANVVLAGHTLLLDDSRTVVSGELSTVVAFSSDPTTLPAKARVSLPAGFVSYLELGVGTAVTAIPAAQVTVAVGTALAGETVTVCNFDSSTNRWGSAQSAVVDPSGEVSFSAGDVSLWAVFRSN